MTYSIYLFTYKRIIQPLEYMAMLADKIADGNINLSKPSIMITRESKALYNSICALAEKHKKLAFAYQSLKTQQQAQKKINEDLTKVNEAKSDLIATLSHEIKTPLTAIIAYSEEILEQEAEIEEVIDNTYDIYQSAHHLLDLITDLLDLSKIEKGNMQLHYSFFDITEILAVLDRIFSPLIKRNNLTLCIETPNDLPAMHADKNKIKQILMNLLSNAIKFTPAGGSISLKVVYQQETKQMVLSVSDTGLGIPEKYFTVIFNKFSQLDLGIAQQYGGIGLGLAITKHLIDLHEGTVWIDSTLGKGSTFFFGLPICRLPKT